MDTLLVLVVTLVLLLYATPGHALQILRVRVPTHAVLHQPAVLSCEYDPQGEPLYSVKWYKDNREFYRYLADETPKIRLFKLPGVEVDISRSDDTKLTLSRVSLGTAGQYVCEVSMDAPTFHTAIGNARINVVATPSGGPRITGLEEAYLPGQVMTANCTIGPSYPKATLRWFINGEEVDRKLVTELQLPATPAQPTPNWAALRLLMDPGLFHGPRALLKLRCLATIDDVFSEEETFTASLRDAPGNQRLAAHSDATPTRANAALAGSLLCVAVLCHYLGRSR